MIELPFAAGAFTERARERLAVDRFATLVAFLTGFLVGEFAGFFTGFFTGFAALFAAGFFAGFGISSRYPSIHRDANRPFATLLAS